MEYSTTQQRIAAVGRKPVLRKPVFVLALAVFGIFSLMAGVDSLGTAIISSPNTSLPAIDPAMLVDAAYKFGLGALLVASCLAFARGRILCVWLYAGGLAADVLYGSLAGSPNYLFIGFGLLLLWQVWHFRIELDLA